MPNHQSHLDYLALNYVLHRKYHGQVPIHIAGGINLNIFPIGRMFRSLGCFFIRRSFVNDRNYRYTLEAYIHYLLKEKIPIEFFFEGGRSRTGKLSPPRFGLFRMILDTYDSLHQQGHDCPLLFIPISIMHEFVPEEHALARELQGGSKQQESTAQLFRLWRFLFKQFGTIHIRIGSPISRNKIIENDLLQMSRKVAFKCYRSVGNGISVTPVSLLGLILLDDPSGALTYNTILKKAKSILNYCQRFDVPVTSKLKGEDAESSILRAIELLLQDKKIKLLKKDKIEQEFYVVEEEKRLELLYFKNSILHQFLTPFFMNSLLVNIANNQVNTLDDLKHLLREGREFLKYEFYLPEVKEIIQKSLDIIHYALGRRVRTLEEVVHLTRQDFFAVARSISPFICTSSYIYEGYYVGCLALKHFGREHFSTAKFIKTVKEIHEMERLHGHIVRFNESFFVPLLKNALHYYQNRKLLRKDGDFYQVLDEKGIKELTDRLSKYLIGHLSLNLETLN